MYKQFQKNTFRDAQDIRSSRPSLDRKLSKTNEAARKLVRCWLKMIARMTFFNQFLWYNGLYWKGERGRVWLKSLNVGETPLSVYTIIMYFLPYFEICSRPLKFWFRAIRMCILNQIYALLIWHFSDFSVYSVVYTNHVWVCVCMFYPHNNKYPSLLFYYLKYSHSC